MQRIPDPTNGQSLVFGLPGAFGFYQYMSHEQLPGRSKKYTFGFLPSLAKINDISAFWKSLFWLKV